MFGWLGRLFSKPKPKRKERFPIEETTFDFQSFMWDYRAKLKRGEWESDENIMCLYATTKKKSPFKGDGDFSRVMSLLRQNGINFIPENFFRDH